MGTGASASGLWWRGAFDPAVSLGERIRKAGVAFAARPAVRMADGSWLTHGTLHTRAEPVRRAIARSLGERGGAVGCLTGTNESLTIALISALTTSPGTTVLDPSLPAGRTRQALSDIHARTLLADRTTVGYARSVAEPGDAIIMLDEDGEGAEPTPVVEQGVLTVFTSGSTGRPKGVRRPYAAMAHTSYNISWRCESTPDDVMLYVGSPGHVGTLNDVLLSVLNGFAAVPVQLADLDLSAIYRLIRELRVNKISMPPSLMRLLLRHAAAQEGFEREVMFCSSGEALLRSDVRLFFEVMGPGSRLWQSYGSTEAGHMFAGNYGPEHARGSGSLPLNSAARGVEVEILGEDGRPVPPGETGQIRVRTPSLALGYTTGGGEQVGGFGQDERGRYFMTGDRAQLLEPGVFVIEGRADRQINLHGRRVELGEIESAILGTPGWGEACAALVPDGAGRTTLLAMVSPLAGDAGDVVDLRERLRLTLPAFAVPARILSVPALPRTTTGKVDLATVRDTLGGTLAAARGGAGQPPRGPTENWVADAWQAVLGIEERPARDVTFDEFGGDSLNAVELCLRFGEKFGVGLGMDFVTAHRTVASQAAALQDTGTAAKEGQRVVPLRRDGEGPICVLVPGAGGHAWVYLGIADAVEGACDLLALNLNFTARDELGIDRLAGTVIDALGDADGSRPLMVVGYSRGSLIACSLADALNARGRSVNAIALLDPSPVAREPAKDRLVGGIRSIARSFRRKGTAGAAARRVLDEQIDATRHEIARLYRPERTRLPRVACSVLGTEETVRLLRARGSLFGRPLSGVDLKMVDGLDHLDLMRKRGAPIVASWLSARMTTLMENARGSSRA